MGSPFFLSFNFLLFSPSSGVPASVRQSFPAYPSFYLPDCVLLHAALLFLLFFRLVRCSLLLHLPSWRFVSLVRVILVGFLSFGAFSSSVLFISETPIFRLLVSAFCVRLLLPGFSVFEFLFYFICTRRSRFRCFVSCLVHPNSVFRFVSYLAFFSFFLCSGLSSSLPVRWVSLSFFLQWVPVVFFRTLFAHFLSCLLSWSSSIRLSWLCLFFL